MIVKMKKVSVVVQEQQKNPMLKTLRKAGMFHVSDEPVRTATLEEIQRETDSLEKIRTQIVEAVALDKHKRKGVVEQLSLTDAEFDEIHTQLLNLATVRQELSEQLVKDTQMIEQIVAWGDFSPKSIAELSECGYPLTFYTIGKKELRLIDESISYIRLKPAGKQDAIAVIGDSLPDDFPATQLVFPPYSLAQLQAKVTGSKNRIQEINQEFISHQKHLDAYALRIAKSQERNRFEEVIVSMGSEDKIAWINGYVPEPNINEFKQLASDNLWGILVSDPTEEDNPPTMVKYPRGVGIVKPVFDIMGTVPGYREFDISMWFLLFFSLFFAMIIGDAGYGLLYVIIAVALNIKQKKVTRITALIYVLGASTLLWGALTGTWFGSEAILVKLPFLQKLVIPGISNFPGLFGVSAVSSQNMVMKFCFLVGTVHLSLACMINVVHKVPKKDLSAIADLCWLISLNALYYLVLMLVVNASVNLALIAGIVLICFALILIFGAQQPGVSFFKGVKSGLGGFFTTFLDTISAFSNIMSYIRLFAVGMATVAIAQSFNSMAAPMLQGIALPAGILVLVIGHALNFVMGLLSVVVHGVRLNLLEFSGQLGMEWTGVAYEPFRETVTE